MTDNLPDIGERFLGRYQIEQVVGYGGYGRIYQARQLDLGRTVALKVIAPPREGQNREPSTLVARFTREAQAISRLSDPHTITMYDHGEAEGLLYMVLEYIDGRSLKEELLVSGAMEPSRVVGIVRQILQSLEEAHAAGLLHRDIKPGNIMIYSHMGRHDCVKVLDFGLAKSLQGDQHLDEENLTADDILVGTPRYMSPEQVRGYDLAPTSDLYSLGLTAIEILTGEQLITDKSAMAVVAKHIAETEFDLSHLPCPPQLREILARMVRKDADERFQSVEEVLLALEDWDRPPAAERRSPIPAVVIGAAVVLIFAIAVAAVGPSEHTAAAVQQDPETIAARPEVVDLGLATGEQTPDDGPAVPTLDPKLLEAVVSARTHVQTAFRLSTHEVADADARKPPTRRNGRRNSNRRDRERDDNANDGRNLQIFEP